MAQPIWEKSFVVVDKEQQTGILCYSFSLGECESPSAEQQNKLASDEAACPEQKNQEKPEPDQAKDAKAMVAPALRDVKSPAFVSEEPCLDHMLSIYKGRYHTEDVSVRILQNHEKNDKKYICDSCHLRKARVMRGEVTDIVNSTSHSYIVKPLIATSTPELSFTIVPSDQNQKSLKEVINSRQNLREGTEEDVRFLCACLTDAVIYLHENQIIHRNICPLTVYLSILGDPILGDFEQAKRSKDLGSYLLGSCGTVGYQSPEVVAQLGYNHTVDFWGIGCVAYEFLFGIMPYVDADVSRMLSKTVLNPDFAFTRLGSRFTRLPKPAQEALRDGFLNRYPHKRTGFKLYETKQLRWFQPYRWDMIRNKQYRSPLLRFSHEKGEPATSPLVAKPESPRQENICQPKPSDPVVNHKACNSSFSQISKKHFGQDPNQQRERQRNNTPQVAAVNNNANNSARINQGPKHINHTAGMFDFHTLLQNLCGPNLPGANLAYNRIDNRRAYDEAINPLQAFIRKHFHQGQYIGGHTNFQPR